MKRIYLTLLALLMGVATTLAVPALPKAVRVMQPDGTYVSIRLVGDEYLHFNMTADGYSVVKDSRGYYVYAQLDGGQLVATAQVAHDEAERTAAEVQFLSGIQKRLTPAMTAEASAEKQAELKRQAKARDRHRFSRYDYSKFRGLLILVEYNDKQFSRDDYKDIVTDMVNAENYTGYTSTNGKQAVFQGSVRDYFNDQSEGQFKPEFDVYGPYQIDYSQYAANGTNNASRVINAAINAADADVDFSQYDRDGDGVVDMIYFIFAGNGANFSGNDSRLYWPHRSFITNGWNYVQKDGVTLGDYASSVELYGWTSQPSSVDIEGIGTICHEFSHVLGLPDFYDTDYEGSGGESKHPGEWSVMSGGSYFNYARNPVGYSFFERYAVGFTTPETISEPGSYSLDALHTSSKGYRINTPQNREYFILENRQQQGWDQYLPGHGMLIFRVDSTRASIWNNNQVNANPSHNYYELVRARGTSSAAGYDPFPGRGNVTVVNNATSPANLKTWAKKDTQFGLRNIKESGGVITFDVEDTYILRELTLPENYVVHVGNIRQIPVVIEPDYASYQLTWKSSDEGIATVDQEGYVTGYRVGTVTISVESNNGLSASCLVSVEQPRQVPTFGELKSLDEGTECVLAMTQAQVLHVNGSDVYLRDASGALVLKGVTVSAKAGDVLSGAVYGQFHRENLMPVMTANEGEAASLKVASGGEVEPRKVTLSELTEADYADMVEVQGATLERTSGVFAVDGDNRARLYNLFKLKGISVPTNIADKVFDITGIYGTDVANGEVINEIYLLKSPTEGIPAGVENVSIGERGTASGIIYDLQGRRVDSQLLKKGIYIQGNRKIMVK